MESAPLARNVLPSAGPGYFRSRFSRESTGDGQDLSFLDGDITWKRFDFGRYPFAKQEKKVDN